MVRCASHASWEENLEQEGLTLSQGYDIVVLGRGRRGPGSQILNRVLDAASVMRGDNTDWRLDTAEVKSPARRGESETWRSLAGGTPYQQSTGRKTP